MTRSLRRAEQAQSGGDIENIRSTSSGHTKANLYDGKAQITTITLHRMFDFFGDYGDQIGGRFKLNLNTEKGVFWESDLANHWAYKASYLNLY